MDAKREFAYERFRRDIQTCEDVKQLQELACKFMRLYLTQQETVDAMARNGWLPQPKTGT